MKNTFLLSFVLIFLVTSNVFASSDFTFSNIKPDDFFGHDIELIGDLDGDGVTDIAVGVPYDNDGANSAGAVYILFLNSDGTVKSSQKISSSEGNFQIELDDSDKFGYSIDNIGDLNNDNIIDIAVGAPGDDDVRELINFESGETSSSRGAVYILFLNSDGTVKSSQKISSSEGNFREKLEAYDAFGRSIANLGDFDGDGVTDIVVGAYHDDDGGYNTGAVYILFLNSDGTVKSSQKISSSEGNFKGIIDSGDCWGNAITGLNDLDGDGITDIAVGSPYRNYYDNELSPLHILFLNSDGTVKSFKTIPEQTIIQGNYDFVYYIGILLFFVILSVLIVWKKFGKNKKQKISN